MAKVYDINEVLLLDTYRKLRRTLRKKDIIRCEPEYALPIKNILETNRIVYNFETDHVQSDFIVVTKKVK